MLCFSVFSLALAIDIFWENCSNSTIEGAYQNKINTIK
jgi:hypothetical protein